jgi:hypothetical protein
MIDLKQLSDRQLTVLFANATRLAAEDSKYKERARSLLPKVKAEIMTRPQLGRWVRKSIR